MTPDPAAVAALARALDTAYTEEMAFYGSTNSAYAAAILATDWTPAERAALCAAIVGAQDVECNPFCTWKSAHLYACGKRIADLEAAPAPDLLAAAREALVRYIAVDGSYGMFDAAALHEAREAAARLVTPKEILDEQDRVLDAIRARAAIEEAP